ncbi:MULTISPECIES: helix-turn-helix domain-containing protein [Micromonospora]|uniref:ArsR family transcriptional regulator n=1 Tax=Micromonospora solifontis TaxID=2487138 RepID=A0ABX9WC55_9ACTN|nr:MULTISPECIES: helix-turn-helix domain-containing protein [Micromonospora]NES13738.1 helix-turn-helix domain-containing protein [Micromonospora sp. PPF5-17B]NES39220.1 helix-turn-helix domain-containing protein [Micromonospora solifontis]NES55295.1 helix-turn-helix domain-containing protein [Micromonospora sp. PPF5-6]RNL89920.1 ArsR family transcriptional regulator [Micromonospora solifontis]
MALDTAELLLHPVRLRIVQAFLGGRSLTTADLRAELADVPPATLYRQVATLAEHGVLRTAGERRVRGAVERSYRLDEAAASVDATAVRSMSPEQHRRAFLTFVAGLLADFDRYLDGGGGDLGRDLAGYRQNAFHATDGETVEFISRLQALFAEYAALGPGPGRTRRLLTTVLLPAAGSTTGQEESPDRR